jgi:hypothetical protein
VAKIPQGLCLTPDPIIEAFFSSVSIPRIQAKILFFSKPLDVAAGRLVRILPDHAPKPLIAQAVSLLHRAAAAPRVRAFIGFVRERLDD